MEPRVQASDFEALVRETCAPQAFVGHRSEKQALYKWMDRTYEKNQSLLFLVGPTGSGKTRLTRAAIARAKRRKNVVCTGICRPAGGPYAPFAGALLEAVTGASPRSVRVRLENCLAEHPKLAELIGHRGATTGRPVNTEMGRDALFRTLAHALLLLASEGPALLVVEDLHLADASTLEFFRYFAPRTRVHRLQMLSTCRTVAEGGLPCFVQTLLDDLHRSCGAARITLGGLTPQDTDALIRSVYRKNLFSQELRRGLHRGSSGNPSIILDALRLFRDQGVIYQEAGVWRERRVPTESNTPFELYETVAHRLEQLNPDVVQFLRLAAICGPTFDPTVIEHALGLNRVRFMRILGALTRIHSVIAQTETACEFTSAPLQETIVRRTPEALRPSLHIDLARGYEKTYGERLEEVVEALAEHYLAGGDHSRALPHLVAAGDRARTFSAMNQAASFYHQALEILEYLPGNSETIHLNIQILRSAGAVHTRLKNWPKAEKLFRDLVRLSRIYEDVRAQAEAWKGMGRIYARRKKFERALTFYQRSLHLFLQQRDPAGECDILIKMGSIYLEQGRWADLQHTYSSALRIARELDLEEQIASVAMNMAILYGIRGDLRSALQAYRQSLNLYRDLEQWDRLTPTLLNMGKCLADHGDIAQAKIHYAACLKLARKQYDILHEAIAQLNLSEILLKENNLKSCEKMSRSALERFEEIDHHIGAADALRILGSIAAQQNDAASAADRFERSLALHRDTGYLLGEAEACRDYARFLQNQPDGYRATELFARAREIFLQLGIKKEVIGIDTHRQKQKRGEPAVSILDDRSGLPSVEGRFPPKNIRSELLPANG